MSLGVSLIPKIEAIEARDWDALVGSDDPFIEHAFLLALEQSGSVGGDSGWLPLHVAVHDAGRLVGALPLYVKLHGYGEYIFDWRWAAAAERSGLRYYPKLVSMVPFTPATGKRVLWAEDADPKAIMQALVQGVFAARDEISASSVHFLFLNQEERDLLVSSADVMPRHSLQFHWHNDNYADFDDYVARFRSPLRKQVRRERKQATQAGIEVRVVPGPELSSDDWSALFSFYIDTCLKRGSGPYLNQAFFEQIRRTHAQRVLAVLAYRAGKPIAGTFNFERGGNLYGRYWGCSEEHASLHFECCYYRLIEHAIARGLRRFEAGAQGTHKLRRGLMPALVHSAHVIQHPGLRQAIAADLVRERDAVHAEIAELSMHGPFKRE